MGCGASTPAYTMEVAPEGLTDLASAAAAADTADASQHGGAGARSRDPNAPVTIEHFEGAGRELIRRDIIGKGGKSVGVQVAYHPRAKEYYAIKFISEDLAAKEQWAVPPQEELAAMRDITLARTPFVVPLRGWFEDGGTLALVMGYMPGGELFSRMVGRKLATEEAAFYLAEVAAALEAIHRLGYIYRDLKPENVLLDGEGHLALCDMGFATKADRAYKRLGTPQYQAPEILAPDVATVGYTRAVDWWAFGCLMFEMMTGHAAFGAAETPVAEVHAKVLSLKGGPAIPGSLPRAARELIAGLLTRDPAKRISTAAAVKAHPFFARVDWEAVRTKRYMSPWIPPPMRFPGDVANFDIYLRMEGQTVVSRGAASRILYEKPIPVFVSNAVTSTVGAVRAGASMLASAAASTVNTVTGLRSRSGSTATASSGNAAGGAAAGDGSVAAGGSPRAVAATPATPKVGAAGTPADAAASPAVAGIVGLERTDSEAAQHHAAAAGTALAAAGENAHASSLAPTGSAGSSETAGSAGAAAAAGGVSAGTGQHA